MTLEDLRIFVAAVEAGSMGALARELGLTQPAVAHHIRRLEEEFGAPLLERSRRGVQATASGRALYDRASAALSALGAAEQEVAEIRDGSDGALAIASSSGMIRHFLKPTILSLRRKRPSLDLRLTCSNTPESQLDAVRERRADLAFVAMGAAQKGFQFRAGIEMPYSLLVHRDDPLAARSRIDLGKLSEIRFIAVGRQSITAAFVDEQLSQHGDQLKTTHVVDTDGTAILYVELGLGHALVPNVQALELAKRAELKALPIRGLAPIILGWAARDFELLPSAAKEFLSLFSEIVHSGKKRNRSSR